MSNSYSTIAQNLAAVAAQAISTRLSVVAACTAFPLEAGKLPGQQRVVSVVKSVSDTQTADNPDYTLGDAVIAPTAINHTLYTQPFGIGNDELNQGTKLAWLYTLNGQKLAAKLSDAISSLLTTTNFGAAIVTQADASFGNQDFETLFGGVATAGRTIILDTPYFSKVKSTWLPPGFNNVLEHTRWSAAGTNVRGFVSDPAAIILSYAMPNLASPHRNVVAEAPFTIPQIGLQGAATIYFLQDTRRLMGCLSIYMGAAVGDSNALKLLVSP
jgi:hypothetical protein